MRCHLSAPHAMFVFQVQFSVRVASIVVTGDPPLSDQTELISCHKWSAEHGPSTASGHELENSDGDGNAEEQSEVSPRIHYRVYGLLY